MRRSSTAGITLIELVVAMAIFALVAIMGAQTLTGTLRQRDRLDEIAQANAGLSTGLAILRNDLGAVVPMLFYPPGGTPRSALEGPREGGAFSVSLAGQARIGAPNGDVGLARAQWRLDHDKKVLFRRVWPTLYPAAQNSLSPEMVVLDGVEAIAFRSFWAGQGWISGLRPPLAPGAPDITGRDEDGAIFVASSYSDTLPLAVEVTLTTARFGDVTILEALR